MPLRRELRRHHIQPVIPHRQRKKRKRKPGHPPGSYNLLNYYGRGVIERTNAWLDNYRRVAVCWDHTLLAFTAWVNITCMLITLNNLLR